MSSSSRKSIVIIGGGLAGTNVSRAFSTKVDPAKYSVTIITPRPFALWFPALLRVVASSKNDIGNKAYLTFDNLFTKPGVGTIKEGKATSIKKNEKSGTGGAVVLESGEEVKFDALIVATGSVWSGPLDFPDTEKEIEAFVNKSRKSVEQANDIVLVGGGSVGIEFSGEIKDFYPGKNVTIVHQQKQLLNAAYPDKFRSKAEQSVRERGVNVVLGETVEVLESVEGYVTTKSGKKIKADLVIPTWGGRPNTAFLETLGQGTLTATGHVKITPNLNLASHQDIFAVGDILDYAEQKQAGKISGHSGVVVANVIEVLEGRKPLKEYKGAYEIILVTNGKNGGFAYFGILWGLVFGNFLTRMLKSKTLLVPLGRGGVGLKD